jgi:hypothetical protein
LKASLGYIQSDTLSKTQNKAIQSKTTKITKNGFAVSGIVHCCTDLMFYAYFINLFLLSDT